MAIALGVANVGQGTASSGVGGLTSISLTTGAAVAANSRIYLGVCIYDGGLDPVFTSVSPGAGLIWMLEGQVGTGGLGDSTTAMLLYADAPAGLASGTVLTVNFSGGGWDASIVGTSFTGVSAGANAAEMSDRTGTTTAWTTGNLTTNAGGLIVAVCANGGAAGTNSNTVTAPSVEDQDYTPTRAFVTLCHRIETSSGSYSVAGTLATAPNVRSSVVGASYAAATAFNPRLIDDFSGGDDADITARVAVPSGLVWTAPLFTAHTTMPIVSGVLSGSGAADRSAVISSQVFGPNVQVGVTMPTVGSATPIIHVRSLQTSYPAVYGAGTTEYALFIPGGELRVVRTVLGGTADFLLGTRSFNSGDKMGAEFMELGGATVITGFYDGGSGWTQIGPPYVDVDPTRPKTAGYVGLELDASTCTFDNFLCSTVAAASVPKVSYPTVASGW